jgi:hypothetical protein
MPSAGQPFARLAAFEVAVKACGGERVLEDWVLGEPGRIDHEVAVLGLRRDGVVDLSAVQVDRLGADEHERVDVGPQRGDGVEQRPARLDVELSRTAGHRRLHEAQELSGL